MAGHDRDATLALERDLALEQQLLEQGGAYDFYQAVRLLRRLSAARGQDPARSLRLRPALGLDLPRAPVAGIERDPDSGQYRVETTFAGLYGVASPLPAFYTEELIEAAQEDRDAGRDFLDLIHQRLHELLIAGIEKYRPLYGAVEQGAGALQDLLSALVGLRDPSLRESFAEPMRLLRYVGLLGPRQRSAEGLKTLLEDAFPEVAVEIEQCVGRSIHIPAASRLALGERANRLGEDALLGHQLADHLGKLVIRLGPLSGERFNELLNDGAQWAWLVGLIRFYLPAPLECELQLLLARRACEPVSLGGRSAQLGRNAWIFSDSPSDGLRASLRLA